MRIDISSRALLAIGFMSLVPATVSAVPSLITFSAGSPIRAADINSNFSTLRTAIANLETGDRCTVNVLSCGAVTCDLTCPSNQHVEAGGCDAAVGIPLIESMPAGPTNFSDGAYDVDFFNRWHCRTDGTGNVQGAYAYCCQN